MKNLNMKLSFAAALCAGRGNARAHQPRMAQSTDGELTFNAAAHHRLPLPRPVADPPRSRPCRAAPTTPTSPSGFYVGTWLSTIKWTKDLGGDGNIEWDIYAGKRGDIAEGISYDVGGLGYVYPSNGLNPSANTFELYGQVGYGPGLHQVLALDHQPVRHRRQQGQRLPRHRRQRRTVGTAWC